MGEIVYIVGDRRSGSTVLENLLNQVEGIQSVGELRMLEGHLKREGPGDKWNWNCSCGESFDQCVYWSRLKNQLDIHSLRTLLEHDIFDSKSTISENALIKDLEAIASDGEQVAQDSHRLLMTLIEIDQVSCIVDSSKDPVQAYFLHKLDPKHVKVIFLQRGLEDIAYSKAKRKLKGPLASVKYWLLIYLVYKQHSILQKVVRLIPSESVLEVQYEDLARMPQKTLADILFFLGKKVDTSLLPDHMEPKESHSIGGTPSRFMRSPVIYDNKAHRFYKNHPLLRYWGNYLNRRLHEK